MPKAVTEVPALPPSSRHLTCGGAGNVRFWPKADIHAVSLAQPLDPKLGAHPVGAYAFNRSIT